MDSTVLSGLLLPFLGTTLGSACVYFMRGDLSPSLQKGLSGFAGGIMVAASVWSLIIPAIEQTSGEGFAKVMPAFVGFWLGTLFLLLLDHVIPHLHLGEEEPEGPKANLDNSTMMVFAVTLHNIPEGMAVGVVLAGMISGQTTITAGAALSLALGIAIQNFPEGAIISMPLHAQGDTKNQAFLKGFLSGAVEPIAALFTMMAVGLVVPAMPYLLSLAAGAMMYVVVEELIPELSEGQHSNVGVIAFSLGFTVMMALDVVLG